MTGQVKALQSTYGFVTAEDGVDYFFHAEDLVDDDVELRVGDRVSFEVVEPQPAKGPRARDVAWLLSAGNLDSPASRQEV